MMPQAGGMYVFFREAFGELPAFLYAWVAFWVILIGSDAAVAIGFAQYLSVFFPSLSSANVLFTLGPVPINAGPARRRRADRWCCRRRTTSGVKEGARIQGVFTSMIVLALLVDRGRRRVRRARPDAAAARPAPAAALTFAGLRHRARRDLLDLLRLERDRGGRRRSRQPAAQPSARADRSGRASSPFSTSPSTPSS